MQRLMSVEELAAATGLSVRTTRYYAGLGLLPAPIRQGRVARYDDAHLARLQLIRALQDHGFTLQAIEKYLSRIPLDAGVEELAVQRAMLRPWTVAPTESLTRRQLQARVGRELSESELERLVALRGVRRDGDGYEATPLLQIAVQALDLDIGVESFIEAGNAIDRHMNALADDLTEILRRQVLDPYRELPRDERDSVGFERTVSLIRQLTLDSVVAGFQRAANQVIQRSLRR